MTGLATEWIGEEMLLNGVEMTRGYMQCVATEML